METFKNIYKIIGLKDTIIWLILGIIEMIINIPYFLLKALCFPIFYLYDNYMDYRSAIFHLTGIKSIKKFSNKMSKKIIEELRGKEKIYTPSPESLSVAFPKMQEEEDNHEDT